MHQPFHDLHSSNAAALRQTPRGRLFCLFKIVNRKQLFFSFISHRLRGHFAYGATVPYTSLSVFPLRLRAAISLILGYFWFN